MSVQKITVKISVMTLNMYSKVTIGAPFNSSKIVFACFPKNFPQQVVVNIYILIN